MKPIFTSLLILLGLSIAVAQKKDDKAKDDNKLKSEHFSGLTFRSVGPAVTSGRVSDFAVNPSNHSEYYVASSAGGVWKTTNHGITYNPIFDGEGSYSIGCVTLDPSNASTVWVGSGENNNQRSVSYGDGVYKSEDGGGSWKNMGLKNSEHISNIIVHPTNSKIIYVGAYGPVWKEGGDRGVYKSLDGGTTWTQSKAVSEFTGCNDLIMDPKNPDILYAAFHQRMRKVFTYIGGGPESAIYKSNDGGSTWKKLEGGLPGGDLGRIGIDISPVDGALFAVIEAREKGGIYKSNDGGASWSKMSGTYTSGNYYNELACDPKIANKIYITDTYYKVSTDGGKTVKNLGELNKHIDNHAIWVDPNDGNHMLVGCDGGVYETYDHAATFDYKENLPITQFYKVATDNDFPFYGIHGGTQDNLSLGGPSRTTSANGIVNADWYVTSLGDGFESQVDQSNPNIVYAQSQYGGLVRYDRKNGEYLPLKPIEGENETPLRWNWDAPLLISQFDNKRLYFGANKIFRTDDQGQSWTMISGDISRNLDRNKFDVMGKVWSVDAVAKNQSTDIFGQSTSIAESKFDENILWVGTDDGLIQLTTNGGKAWTKIDNLPGVPAQSYVHQIIASVNDKNTAFVCFNHHRYGDFKPYVLKTTDLGKTWTSIKGDLPERGSIYSIAEDGVDKNLLFVGTEFGLFFTNNGGVNWYQMKSGLPTIAVRDIEIQRRENDLVLATFGRGFYVLDDYTALRNISKTTFEKEASIFPIKDSWMYNERYPLGLRGKGHLGSSYFTTPNPEVGAVFTYYVKDDIKKIKEIRKDREKKKTEAKETIYYPEIDSLRAEDQELDPYLLFTIKDAKGNVVRHLKTSAKKGMKRLVWDMRAPTYEAVEGRYSPAPDQLFGSEAVGHFVAPGTYSVSISKYKDGVVSPISNEEKFTIKLLDNGSIMTKDMNSNVQFFERATTLQKEVDKAGNNFGQFEDLLNKVDKATLDLAAPNAGILKKSFEVRKMINEAKMKFYGDNARASREFETAPSIASRAGEAIGSLWRSTSPIPKTYLDNLNLVEKQFNALKPLLQKIESETLALVKEVGDLGGPYIGR